MVAYLIHRWFLLSLLATIGIGIIGSPVLVSLTEAIPRRAIVATVLFLMALPLELKAIGRVLQQPAPGMLAMGLNIGLVPPLAWLVSCWLPHGLAEGMVVAAAVPCTLASAAVWTRRAGGNDAVALFVTIMTNLACFLVAPAWIWLLLGAQIKIAIGEMVLRLVLLVVLPIVLAQLLRSLPQMATWATGQKIALGVVAQLGILCMVFIGAVKSGGQLQGTDGIAVAAGDWFVMLSGVLGVHLLVLWIGWIVAHRLRFERSDAIAVAFAGSQKTLMVGLDLTIQYASLFGGLAMLPMVAYHIGQLVVDTLIADHWRNEKRGGPLPFRRDR